MPCHPNGLCLIEETQETLLDYLKKNPSATGESCKKYGEFPILIKLIDAAKPLSIQVHPDDSYASTHGGQSGKMELWYIIDCDPGATIFYGLEEQVSLQQFQKAIADNTLCDLLNCVAVHKGDSFFIEAGTIHAIGAGILIAEVQQSSDLTYRVYDYGRIDADGKTRPLHLDEAYAVSHLGPAKARPKPNTHLERCDFFTVDLLSVCSETTLCVDASSFHSLLVLEGEMTVCWNQEELQATKGASLFIEANTGEIKLSGNAKVLHTYLN